jgi:type II secretory ATPase GspE/PulE/Tfp pilus assembly ATPase PilB-like protein
MKTDPIRLACLFYETGMIDSEAFAQCSVPQQEQSKSILTVLNQEASARTFRDLLNWTSSMAAAATATLTMEIDLPFTGKHKEADAEAKSEPSDSTSAASSIHRALSSQSLFLQDDLCQALLNAWKPDISDLIAALSDAGVVANPVQIREKVDKGANAYDRLLELDELKDADAINHAAAFSRFKRLNRLLLSLSMLKRNDILNEEDCNAILLRIKEDGFGAIPNLNEEVKRFIAVEPDMPEAHVKKTVISSELLARFPETFIRQNTLLPLRVVLSSIPHLEIAVDDPFYVELTDALALLIGMPVVGYFAPGNDIISRINDFYAGKTTPVTSRGEAETSPVVETPDFVLPVVDKPAPASAKVKTNAVASSATVEAAKNAPRAVPERMADSYSAVEMVSTVIENGIEYGATDIHLEPQAKELRVRYRVDGRLRTITRIPESQVLPVTSRIKVLAALDVTERRRPQDGHFSLRIGESAFDFRISTLPTRDGEKTVIRVLDERRVLHNLGSLGVPKKQGEIIHKWIARPHGLVLVTGPTGSGKTSTLYAALNTVNQDDKNIVTIEDPVEYRLNGINQVQVDASFNLGFAEGLRSILRQDPDIIMVGEIRDPETARIAMRAALTGHLVFSTLHTNTAAGAIATLMNMGVEPYMLTSAISGIISQRLLRCLCPECKKSGTLKREQMEQLRMSEMKRKKIWLAQGCPACLGSGYKGRTGVYEIMPMTPDLIAAILTNKGEAELVSIMRSSGFGSLLDAAVEKMMQGITSPDEILDSLSLDE